MEEKVSNLVIINTLCFNVEIFGKKLIKTGEPIGFIFKLKLFSVCENKLCFDLLLLIMLSC